MGEHAREPSVDLVVAMVNYRSAALTLRALETLEPEVRAHGSARAIVVDNDSGEGPTLEEGVRERGFQSWVQVETSPRNGGFAYGNNRIIRRFIGAPSAPTYFWLLNPDTEVLPDALQALLDFMADHPRCGIAGSRFFGDSGEEYRVAYRFPNLFSELDDGLMFGPVTRLLTDYRVHMPMTDTPQQVDWLPGASMMIRREVFEQAGLMDEGYFLYYEETDLCFAAAQKGWQTWHVPQSKVIHNGGGSTGLKIGTGVPKRLPAHWFESRRRYFMKNYGVTYTVAADVVHVAALSLSRARMHLEKRLRPRKTWHNPPYLLLDSIVHSVPGHAVRNALRRRG